MDVDIIRDVFVKESKTFPNRFTIPSGRVTEQMLNNVTDYDAWKRMRSLMSPTFSTGKLKQMTAQINRCARQCLRLMLDHCSDHRSMEVKEFAGCYTMDVIASTAFGLDLNTKEDHNNQFAVMARKAFNFKRFNPAIMISFFFPVLSPLLKWLDISLFDKDVVQFFADVTEQTLRERDNSEGDRVDFLTLMKRAHQDDHSVDRDELIESEGNILLSKQQRGMSHDEVVAQGLLFFLAGYETTASAISFLAYSLATNPDCQDKLRQEIAQVMAEKDDDVDVTHEDLQKTPYLEMCINETLRMYPSVLRLDRVAAHDTVVGGGIKVPAGGLVSVPIWLLHRNPQYYPNPEKFIPERFSAEEKNSRSPLCFLPFGAGPRNCLAMRLAMLEVKVVMLHILRHHRFVTTPDTQVPLELAKFGLLKAENGIHIKLEEWRM